MNPALLVTQGQQIILAYLVAVLVVAAVFGAITIARERRRSRRGRS